MTVKLQNFRTKLIIFIGVVIASVTIIAYSSSWFSNNPATENKEKQSLSDHTPINADELSSNKPGNHPKAVTIQVNPDTHSTVGIEVGDRVDVLHIYRKNEAPTKSQQNTVKVLIQGLRVLAIYEITLNAKNGPMRKAFKLEVTAEEAKILALAGQAGEFLLTLNSHDEAQIPGTIIYQNLIDGNAGKKTGRGMIRRNRNDTNFCSPPTMPEFRDPRLCNDF